jgi:hypothetical protein
LTWLVAVDICRWMEREENDDRLECGYGVVKENDARRRELRIRTRRERAVEEDGVWR